jgi:signal transduction histidine kinase
MSDAPSRSGERPRFGLSWKLITMIVVTILAVEVLIYLPSVANFRASWLDDRIRVGGVAARVIDVVPDAMNVPDELAESLLRSAGAVALVIRREGQSQLIERPDVPMPKAVVTADMRVRDPMSLIAGAIEELMAGGDRVMRVVGTPPGAEDTLIEVLMSDTVLRADMFVYSRNIFILSLIVAAFTSVAIYMALDRLLVRPFGRITANMIAFRETPENAGRIIVPSARRDEIGVAERELAALETDLFEMLHQRKHLADLGLAVAKINHDLRNTLGAAQLLSDQVATLEDPKVQRLAPRLVQTLDRAIGFAQSVLDYGRQSATVPKPQPVDMRALVVESAAQAALFGHPAITFENHVPDDLILKVDPEQIGRVTVNLLKNAREAIESAGDAVSDPKIAVGIHEERDWVTIEIADNGPGLPLRARENLFQAFQGSGRSGGTGLGLVIARELTEVNGGRLRYVDTGEGASFAIDLPAANLV